jgi:hypothetical protein
MSASEIAQHFDSTIRRILPTGASTKTGALSHVRTNSYNNHKFTGVHLGVNMSKFGIQDPAIIRKAIKDYFKDSLSKDESLRCLLGLRNEPRIDFYLRRQGPLLDSQIGNQTVKALIAYWCGQDGLSLH